GPNSGPNAAAVQCSARRTDNPRFANDSYRLLVQMYGEVVECIPAHKCEEALTDLKRKRHVQHDTELDQSDLTGLIGLYKSIFVQETGREFPQDAREQLTRAVRAVFDSWDSPRAQVYRRTYGIPDDLGTAVNVVQMVFAKKGEQSGTGVAFTRDPSTGEQGLYGESLANADGETAAAGIR